MDNHFKVIFFDLGDTLIYDKEPWDPILSQADAAMRDSLRRSGYHLDASAYGAHQTIFDLYYERRKETLREETTVELLREILGKQGASVPEPVLLAAMEAMYAVTQQNWYVEEDAAPTLQALKDKGYRLGLLSNASDDENVQELIDKAGLRPYFEFILSSAACGVRKPDPAIFQRGLDHFDIPPERAVMVGDTMDADILGANRMGIYSIWINRRANYPMEGELPIQPQAVIAELSELPDILQEIEKDLRL